MRLELPEWEVLDVRPKAAAVLVKLGNQARVQPSVVYIS
jgi:hypothetical protein